MYKEKMRKSFAVISTLLIVYLVVYFGTAILTSKELKAVSTPVVAGLSVGVWLGMFVIVVSVIVTRLYLQKWMKGSED